MSNRNVKLECLQLLLRPLVRFCLRNGHSFQDYLTVSKVVFVREAADEIKSGGNKVNVSRLSALTGIYREDIARIYHAKTVEFGEPLSVLSRVVGQWEQDRRFKAKNGRPKTLTCDGEGSEFYKLVYAVSAHLNPGTILFELERAGIVKRSGSKVTRARQLARPTADLRKGYELIASDIQTLIDAGEQNLSPLTSINNLHIRTEFDNVFVKDIASIRAWLIKEGKAFHRKVRDYLSKFDNDISTTTDPNVHVGGRVAVIAAAFCNEPRLESEQEAKSR